MKTDQDMTEFFASWDANTISNLAYGYFEVVKTKVYTHLHPIQQTATSTPVKFRTDAEVIAFLRSWHETRTQKGQVL